MAVQSFAALAQDTRLKTFRLLVEAGPKGLTAGAIRTELDIPHTTLSFHLSHLCHTGLVTLRREGRNSVYSAHFAQVEALIRYLTEHCCRRTTEEYSVETHREINTQ